MSPAKMYDSSISAIVTVLASFALNEMDACWDMVFFLTFPANEVIS